MKQKIEATTRNSAGRQLLENYARKIRTESNRHRSHSIGVIVSVVGLLTVSAHADSGHEADAPDESVAYSALPTLPGYLDCENLKCGRDSFVFHQQRAEGSDGVVTNTVHAGEANVVRYDSPASADLAPTRDPLRYFTDENPEGFTHVALMFSVPASRTIVNQLALDELAGRISSLADRKARRLIHLAELQGRIAISRENIESLVLLMGGQVGIGYSNFPVLEAWLDLPTAEFLASAGLVQLIANADIDAPQTTDIEGRDAINGMQLAQFLDNDYDGYVGSTSTRLHAAILELNKGTETDYNDEHPGFKTNSSSFSRIRSKGNCNNLNPNCGNVTNFIDESGGQHAVRMAAAMFGDIEDGQDPAISGSNARRDRSGYGQEIYGHMYMFKGSGGYVLNALEALDGIESDSDFIHLLNMSFVFKSEGDTSCDGDTLFQYALNDFFQAGHLGIASASNDGHGSSTDCRVESPGSAMGVFTVGAHVNKETTADEDDVRNGDIYQSNPAEGSSRGGTSSQGGGRSIVDITSPGRRTLLHDFADTYTRGAVDVIGAS